MKYCIAAGLVLIASLAIVHPAVESGMNDDWSFVRTAQDLAVTGHLRYNGWSSPLVGFQAFWAAVLIKLFGFSFLIARASSWVLSLLSIPILYRVFRRVGLSERQAFFGVLLFLLSPLVLPNISTFMTDMPAFVLFSAGLLCALEAWNTEREKTALALVVGATVCEILSGSIRQVYWLSGIGFLIVLGWKRIHSFYGRLLIATCLALTIVSAALMSIWQMQQEYVPADITLSTWRESPWREIVEAAGGDVIAAFVGLAVISLPVTLPIAWRAKSQFRLWVHILNLAGSFLVAFLLADPMPWRGNTITNYGIIMSGNVAFGEKPEILSATLMLALATCGIAAAIYAFPALLRRFKSGNVGAKRLAVLTLPFLAVYTGLVSFHAPQFGVYDRYFIPHFFVVLTLTLAVYGTGTITFTTGGLFALYALATTHDYFAEGRAKLEAANSVLRAGYPRTAVIGGFEFDCWTQIEHTGFVNNDLIQRPPNAYREIDDCNGGDNTLAWWRTLAPDLAARYVVSLTPFSGRNLSEYKTIEYQRWLPFGTYYVYLEKVGTEDPALTCKPEASDLKSGG